jgi:hypothetical protein
MSRHKGQYTATMYLKDSGKRQEDTKKIIKVAEKAKKEAIKAANEPMGACLFIAVFMLALIIAPPLAIVLL